MRLIHIVFLTLAIFGMKYWLDRDEGESKPLNVLFILADDLGYGDLGCFGQEHIKTPAIDSLAVEGMKLTQHYSGSPVCAPSRCVLLTGKHTGVAYIRDNDEMYERGDVWNDPALEGQRPLLDSEYTLGELFQEKGYLTSFIGKWGLGWTGTEGDPNNQGFEHFYGYICQRVAHSYYPDHLQRNQDRVLINPGGIEEDYAADLMIEEAIEVLDKKDPDQPLFMVYATPVPHLALQVPQDSLDEYLGKFEETPYDGTRGYLPHETPRAAYAAMITRMDRDIQRLLDKLEELGIADNTLVVFTSDNGPSWIGGCDLEFFKSQGGLRGRKAQVYEGGLRVPTVVRWPGIIPAGSESDFPSAFWDWWPTFYELIDIKLPGTPYRPFPSTVPALSELSGESLMPALRGEDIRGRTQPLYWEHNGRSQAILHEGWKLLRTHQDKPWELYHLDEDIAESEDLADKFPEKVSFLVELIEKERFDSELFPLK
jgi:arylsulfatase A